MSNAKSNINVKSNGANSGRRGRSRSARGRRTQSAQYNRANIRPASARPNNRGVPIAVYLGNGPSNTTRGNNNQMRPKNNMQLLPPPMQNFGNLSTGASSTRNTARLVANLSQPRTSRPMQMSNTSMKDFACCRVDPFNSTGSLGIPDSDQTPRITVDYRTYVDIAVLNTPTNIQLVVFPTLPVIASMSTSQAVTVSDSLGSNRAIAANNLQTTLTGVSAGYSPIGIPAEWIPWCGGNVIQTVAGAPVEQLPLYQANRARVVSCASRLSYTGQAFICAGVISVSHGNFDAPLHDPIQNGEAVYSYNTQTGVSAQLGAINTVPIVKGNITTTQSSYQRETVAARPETGMTSVVKHQTDKFNWQPVSLTPYFVTTGYSAAATFPVFSNTTNYQGQICFHDPEWRPTVYQIANANINQTYRLELYLCMEFAVDNGSPYERFAKIPPSISDKQIEKVEKVAQTMPIATPSDKPSAFEDFLKIALRIGAMIL